MYLNSMHDIFEIVFITYASFSVCRLCLFDGDLQLNSAGCLAMVISMKLHAFHKTINQFATNIQMKVIITLVHECRLFSQTIKFVFH